MRAKDIYVEGYMNLFQKNKQIETSKYGVSLNKS